jgi:DUF4097 and DUF4098 domain-containing protein YvlB
MHRSFDTPDQVHVIVENAVGLVAVTARDTAVTEVTLMANSDEAQELVDRASIDCTPSGGRAVVRVKVPSRHGPRFMRRNGVTVTVTMPKGGDVDVATASADVDLMGPMGALSLKTASGDVSAEHSAGNVQAKSASGTLSIGDVGGSLRLHSSSGDLRAGTVLGQMTATTASGDVDVRSAIDRTDIRCTSGHVCFGHVAGDASIVGVSGDVRVASCDSGRVRIRAVSGDVSVGIPKGINLMVDAESMSGVVRSDIPLGDAPMPNEGAPEVVVSARTVSGDILVERAVSVPVGSTAA